MNHERNLARLRQRGIRRYNEGRVSDAMSDLLRAKAHAEITAILEGMNQVVCEQLENQITDTMRKIYANLRRDGSLRDMHDRLFREGRWSDAVDVLLTRDPMGADLQGMFRSIMDFGVDEKRSPNPAERYALAARIWKNMLSEKPVQEAYARGNSLRAERQVVNNHLMRVLESDASDESVETAWVDRLIDMCTVARDERLLDEFRLQAKTAGKDEWAYRAGKALTAIAQETADRLPSSHERTLQLLRRAMEAGEREKAIEAAKRFLRQHGMPPEGVDAMLDFARWLGQGE
jgi:hypothetical protein